MVVAGTLRLMRELADHRQAEQSLLETQEELKASKSLLQTIIDNALERYPFYVVSGLSEADTMAAWRDRILVVAGLGGILLLALSAVLSILYRVQGELRQISHALGKSREQLREAQRLAQVGRWELVPEESMSWSSELYAILELDPEKVQGSYELFLSYVHPDDRFGEVLAQLSSGQKKLDILCIEGSLMLGPDGSGQYDTWKGRAKIDIVRELAPIATHVLAMTLSMVPRAIFSSSGVATPC